MKLDNGNAIVQFGIFPQNYLLHHSFYTWNMYDLVSFFIIWYFWDLHVSSSPLSPITHINCQKIEPNPPHRPYYHLFWCGYIMFLDPNNLPIHSMNTELEISLAQYWPEMQNWWIIKMHSVHFSNCPAKPREEQITFLPFSNPKEWNSSHVSHRVMIYGKVGVMRELCRFEASLRERTNTRLTLNSWEDEGPSF